MFCETSQLDHFFGTAYATHHTFTGFFSAMTATHPHPFNDEKKGFFGAQAQKAGERRV
jgi:hypothetical protein